MWEIQPEDLQLGERIDKSTAGTFGEVYKATWNSITVAVKKLKQEHLELDSNVTEEFFAEV